MVIVLSDNQEGIMSKQTIAKNLNSHDLRTFEDFYDEISSNWELKAERMIKRRERALRAFGRFS